MQSYETIDLNEYVQTGAGGTAVSYSHKSGKTLVKLYNSGFEAERAKAEFLTARTVFEIGIPTPEPYRLVTDGERFGAEYELIPNKRSFTRIISQEPERLQEISTKFALWARKLHETATNDSHLRSYKQVILQFYRDRGMVSEAFKQRALAFLEKVPEPKTLLHGDLQIGNIISDGKRTLWIDVGDFSYGCPEWDVAMIWIMSQRMTEEQANRLFHLSHEKLKEHWDIFLPAYLGTTDPQALDAYIQRLMPFYALKVPYMYDMAFHASLPEDSLQYLIQLIDATSVACTI